MLGQLAGQEQADGGLDLARGDGAFLVVVGETAGFGGDALEDVVHERVHDRHGLGGDAGVRVHLLQHLVDVDAVGFPSPLSALLLAGADGFGLAGLLGTFRRHFGRHDSDSSKSEAGPSRPPAFYESDRKPTPERNPLSKSQNETKSRFEFRLGVGQRFGQCFGLKTGRKSGDSFHFSIALNLNHVWSW